MIDTVMVKKFTQDTVIYMLTIIVLTDMQAELGLYWLDILFDFFFFFFVLFVCGEWLLGVVVVGLWSVMESLSYDLSVFIRYVWTKRSPHKKSWTLWQCFRQFKSQKTKPKLFPIKR